MTAADLASPPIRSLPHTCILFALPQERKMFRLTGRNEYRVTHSGAGSVNAGRTATNMLSIYDDAQPTVIICGFGGALTPAMQSGDLIIADSVADATEGLEYGRERLTPDARLLSAAREQRIQGIRIHCGMLVTANQVLITAHEKREWNRHTGAIAVDMETAGAANAAVKRGAPWISIRAVTDDSDHDLPLNFNTLIGEDGSISNTRAVLACLLRPWAVPGLMKLNKASALAGKNLALFLDSFLRQLPLAVEQTGSGE